MITTRPSVDQLTSAPCGDFYTVFFYRGKEKRRYWVVVPCSHCSKQTVVDRGNFRKHGTGKAYCSRSCMCTDRLGEKNHKWSGGKKNKRGRKGGHILVYAPTHPHSKNNFVPEHRLVLEKATGEIISKDLVVHHIDLDETHNVPENLIAVTPDQHNLLHWQMNRLIKPLMEMGIVRFCRENLTYVLASEPK